MTASSLTAALLLAGNEGGLSVVHTYLRGWRGTWERGSRNLSLPSHRRQLTLRKSGSQMMAFH